MAGIYIHIPFCRQACHYCNFHFSTSLQYKNEMVLSLAKEIMLTANEETGSREKIHTIYFGGGTPSILEIEQLNLLMETVRNYFDIDVNAEVTLEANPDDINPKSLAEWKLAGINRLSIGIQSFQDKDLQWMNRVHNAGQALQAIMDVKNAGFDNYSIDLIYGTPSLSDEEWQSNVAKIIELKVPHISCYALTVEPKTALYKMIEQKKKQDVDMDKQASQFIYLMNWLEKAGYEHYEISNFCLPGWRSRHNSSYWEGTKYYGIGPGAHAFNGKIRRWNVSNNALYIQSIEKGLIPYEEERLTPVQQINEYIMTALRTVEGIDLDKITNDWGDVYRTTLLNMSQSDIEQGKMTSGNNRLVLTKTGKLFADGIAAALFFDEPAN